MPKAEVEKLLSEAVTTVPDKQGSGSTRIWGVGQSGKGVALRMQYAADAPVLRCDAAITEVSADKTRVVPDCGIDDKGSAIRHVEMAIHVPMFEEHIQSTLGHRVFNRATVESKERGIVMANLGGMQREALKAQSDMQRMEASVDRNMPGH